MSCISATYDYAALQATACPICMEDKHCMSYHAACPIPFLVTYPVLRLHTCMMTQLVTWWRLYEHTLLWWPISHRVEYRFYIVQFNIDFTLQVKLILPLVNPETNSLWDIVPFPICWKLVAILSITNKDHLIIIIILISRIIMMAPYSWLGMTYIPISETILDGYHRYVLT